MAFKIFLDTNIVMDFFVPSRKDHENAKEVIGFAEEGDILGFLSESVVNTTAYLVRKSIYFDDFKLLMNELIGIVSVLPCSNQIIHNAYRRAQNDLEDAVLYQIALEHNLDYFVTSDIKDYKKIALASLPVITSSQLIKLIKNL
ncbi:MAG TPA: type II toxin-antitoxin system VapC family toxin [Chitinophagaceae bacterium]|nr:type II toxin-antitoxin system VapC family toxin [Chitinophagaceae bacterium]